MRTEALKWSGSQDYPRKWHFYPQFFVNMSEYLFYLLVHELATATAGATFVINISCTGKQHNLSFSDIIIMKIFKMTEDNYFCERKYTFMLKLYMSYGKLFKSKFPIVMTFIPKDRIFCLLRNLEMLSFDFWYPSCCEKVLQPCGGKYSVFPVISSYLEKNRAEPGQVLRSRSHKLSVEKTGSFFFCRSEIETQSTIWMSL